MSKTHQHAFNGGILGPGMYDRTDLAKYQSGVSDAQNLTILPQGGMQNRAGTKLAGGYDSSTVDGHQWIIPFEFSATDTYALEFSDAMMRVIKNGAYVLNGAFVTASCLAITASATPAFTVTDATEAATFTVGRLYYLLDPNGDSVFDQQIFKCDSISGADVRFSLSDGTVADTSTGAWGAVGAGAQLFEVYEVASPYAIEDLPEIDVAQDVNTLYIVHEGYDPRQLVRVADDDWTFSTLTFEPQIGSPTGISVTASAGTGTDYTYTVAAIDEESGEEGLPGTEATVNGDLTTAGNKNTVTWTAVTGASRYRVYREVNGLFGFVGDTLDLSFVDENIVADTTRTTQQARDPVPTADDRPTITTFIEQRLVFAATLNNPQAVEMSTSQTPLNFNRAVAPTDDDAVTFRMRGQKLNRVAAVVPNDPHIIFTVGGEWTLEGGDQKGYITPSNPIVRPLTYFGSAEHPKPLLIGETILHVLNNGRHVREMRPSRDVPSAEVTLLARHLFKRRRITSWAYAQHPDSIVWVTLDTGELLTLTYLQEHEVWGWTRQVLGGSGVKAKQVATVREGAVDAVYLVVERTLANGTTTFVERIGDREFETVSDCHFTDGGFQYDGAATSALTGLLHLRGQTVVVLADGNVQEGLTVTDQGVLVLPYAASKVSVGLSYEAFLVTLGVDFGSLRNLGSARGRYKAASEVTVGVEESRGIAVGTEDGLMNEVKEFTGVTPIPLLTGQYTVTIDGDWERDARIKVLQSYPLPMTVTGISPDWELEDG